MRPGTVLRSALDVIWGVRRPWGDPAPAPHVRTPIRLLLALLIGLFGAAQGYVETVRGGPTARARDISQVLYASRVVAEGHDPYAMIGPGRPFEWENGFYYPLTAAVATMPIAFLPRFWAEAVFLGFGCAALAWALMSRGYAALLTLATPVALGAYASVQWSPLLTAGLAMPALAVFWAAKPNIGLALFAARPNILALVGGLLLTVVSLVLDPTWPLAWRDALAETALTAGATGVPYLAPITMPFGFLLLLALFRWRRWDARLLLALACVPQTLLPYEALPLFLVPRTALQYATLAATSWGVVPLIRHWGPYHDKAAWFTASGTAMVWAIYLPALVMILMRPNRGDPGRAMS